MGTPNKKWGPQNKNGTPQKREPKNKMGTPKNGTPYIGTPYIGIPYIRFKKNIFDRGVP